MLVLTQPAARWLARLVSVLVNAYMLMLLSFAVINEDPIAPQGRPVVALIGVCMLVSLVSWRWARVGGWLTLIGVAALAVAVIASSRISGFGLDGMAVAVFIYTAPYLGLGIVTLIEAASRSRGQVT